MAVIEEARLESEVYLINVPNLEYGLLVKKGVLEEAISCSKSDVLAFGNGTIREHKFLQEIEIVTSQ